MDLRPDIPLALLGQTLDEVRRDLLNVRGAGSRFADYIRWTDDATTRLTPLLSPKDLDRAVTSRRYWQLRTWDTTNTPPTNMNSLVQVEVQERVSALDEILCQFQDETRRWSSGAALMFPDTNIYMHHRLRFDEIDWHDMLSPDQRRAPVELLVPLLVVEELDNARTRAKGTNAQTRARDALKRLVELFEHSDTRQLKLEPVLAGGDPQQFPVTARLLMPDPTRTRLPIADDELTFRIARGVQDWADRSVHFVTLDVPNRLRARSAGLQVIFRPQDRADAT